MAGDWIKMRTNLPRSPKVVRIASALHADRLRAIGGLHAVWSLFDEHSEDGQIDGYTLDTIDDLIGWPGFSAAMLAVGWLEIQEDGSVCLPRFDEHNGQSAKRRAMETQRKRAERAAAQDVDDLSASDADKKRSREEKRREEKKTPIADAMGGARKRASRLPDDWALPKAWGEWALSEFQHWTPDIVRTEAAKFADHWHSKSGKDATKADWLATWRNWCRSDIAQRAHATRPAVKPQVIDTAARNAEAAAILGFNTVPAAAGVTPFLAPH